jgi:zinc transport system permease protein
VQGLPVGLLSTLFTVLTAATIVTTVRTVGVLLVSALLIIPASTSLLFTGGFAAALRRSVGFALLAVLAGLFVSATWNLAPGGTIALCAAAIFFAGLVTVVLAKRTGF